MKTLLPLLSLTALLLGSGCVASIGGSSTHRGEPTLGKQLMDLRAAKQEGALTEEEYQAQKAKLLNGK